MSGAQTYAGPNVLYDPLMASRQTSAENVLMQQQQNISEHQIEMGARLASTLLDPTVYPTTEARAAAYPSLVANARRQYPGYFTNAPDTYPGDEPTRVLARMGTPSQTQAEWQANIAGNDAYTKAKTGAGTPPQPAGPGGDGGSTGTVGGADTAPINAAGDSRTRKASEGGPPAAGSPGAAVAQQVHDFWISKGYSEPQVAGIMAGGPGSESNFIPTASGDSGTSIGLYQHHGSRLHNAQGTGLFDRYGPNPTADQQNEYAHWEITQGPLKNVGEMLKTAKTPAEAAAIWTQYFGVPADKTEIGRRAAGAGRYLGLYGQPQQAGPGGATATAAPPGVQMGGDAPPPPGGAPGVYPAKGAGVGAVVGQGVQPNIGGPQLSVAPPPVIRAQPIPAGRTAAADAIQAGIQQAQATPLPGTQVAGPPMVASTQPTAPVAAEDLTPTPARYAGTTPAPSVEAPPETGWGTGVGSGYGPQNALAPSPPSPPARPAVSAVTPAAKAPPAPPAPAGSPPPPRLEPLNGDGLTALQEAQLDALGRTGRLKVTDRMAREQQLAQQNIATQQKAFSDWIQIQQLQTSQGQLSVAQQNSALEYWKAANPEAKVTLSGGEIITQDPRNGKEIAPRIKVTPNEAPRTVDGTAVEENGQWRQPKPGEQGVPGKWTVGPAGGQFFPEAAVPGQAGYKVREKAYGRDSDQVVDIANKGQAAQMDQVRIKEMQDQLERIVTGPGTATKVNMTAWLQRWLPNAVNPFTQQTQGLSDAAAAEVFNKLAFRNATTQERSVAGSRGAGARMTEMFLQSNPGLELLTDANQRMLNVMKIGNQADIDNTQGALNHFHQNEQAFQDTNGKSYTSLNKYNADWQSQRNPEVFAAAASAAAGLPARDGEVNGVKFKGWANELSAAEEKRVLEIVARAAPGTRVNTKGGDIIARPQAPATPPMPPGYQPVSQ